MRTFLAILVVATSALVFTTSADAQCACAPTVSYYAPVATTTYYAAPVATCCAPTIAYAVPTAACCAPACCAPTTAHYAPATAYYGGGGYYNSYYGRGGLFGTGLFGWAGLRGFDRRWDRRLGPEATPY